MSSFTFGTCPILPVPPPSLLPPSWEHLSSRSCCPKGPGPVGVLWHQHQPGHRSVVPSLGAGHTAPRVAPRVQPGGLVAGRAAAPRCQWAGAARSSPCLAAQPGLQEARPQYLPETGRWQQFPGSPQKMKWQRVSPPAGPRHPPRGARGAELLPLWLPGQRRGDAAPSWRGVRWETDLWVGKEKLEKGSMTSAFLRGRLRAQGAAGTFPARLCSAVLGRVQEGFAPAALSFSADDAKD